MKNKYFLTIYILFYIFVFFKQTELNAQNGYANMNEKNIIWTTMNVWMKADPDKGKMGSYEVTKFAFTGYDFVKNCSKEIKIIIAFYSKLYIIEEEKGLAEALGNFSSLKAAQEQLLKGKEHFFEDIRKENYGLGLMSIIIDKDIVYVTLQSHNFGNYHGTYKFRIHENGDIERLKMTEDLYAFVLTNLY